MRTKPKCKQDTQWITLTQFVCDASSQGIPVSTFHSKHSLYREVETQTTKTKPLSTLHSKHAKLTLTAPRLGNSVFTTYISQKKSILKWSLRDTEWTFRWMNWKNELKYFPSMASLSACRICYQWESCEMRSQFYLKRQFAVKNS